MGAMRIGNYRESISHEANEVIFRGTTATMLQVNLILPDGNRSVLWTGNTIHVDAKYTIAPERFSYWNQSPAFDRNVRTITITACGSRRHPISLWQANRWYMVRFEEHFSAIIMPREMYYPLKLSFMRSFMESILPNRPSPVSSRSSNSSDRRSPSIVSYESPRGPPTSPHTPEMPHSSNQWRTIYAGEPITTAIWKGYECYLNMTHRTQFFFEISHLIGQEGHRRNDIGNDWTPSRHTAERPTRIRVFIHSEMCLRFIARSFKTVDESEGVQSSNSPATEYKSRTRTVAHWELETANQYARMFIQKCVRKDHANDDFAPDTRNEGLSPFMRTNREGTDKRFILVHRSIGAEFSHQNWYFGDAYRSPDTWMNELGSAHSCDWIEKENCTRNGS